MATMEQRIQLITKSTDELVRRIENWMKDDSPAASPIVPESVEFAIEAAIIAIREGDIPQCCQQLAIAVPRLGEEFRKYNAREAGSVRDNSGAPGPAFWAAAIAVAKARAGADAPLIEQLEPVGVLLKQGVTHDQIARHIYGRRGVGPFMQDNGVPNVALLEKEAANPGSVIPSDWVPPWHQQAAEARKKELAGRLVAYDEAREPRRYNDPGTIESMLRDGCYVQQIEVGKNVTRAEVLAEAVRLGLPAVDGPTYRPAMREISHEDGTVSAADTNAGRGKAASASAPAGEVTSKELKKLILDKWHAGEGQVGAAEIAQELRKSGHDINTQRVSATIGHYKKAQKRAASADDADSVESEESGMADESLAEFAEA